MACGCIRCVESCNSLSLDRFRQLLLPDVPEACFWGLRSDRISSCGQRCFRDLGGKLGGRQSIRDAIRRAESMLAEELGFWPGPHWTCKFARRQRRGYVAQIKGVSGQLVRVEPYLLRIGERNLLLLDTVEPELSDWDSDTLPDHFLARTTAPLGIAAEDVAVAYDLPGAQPCPIAGLQVEIVDGEIQVRGHVGQIVLPDAWALNVPLDVEAVDVLATSLRIYRVTVLNENHADLRALSGCGNDGCDFSCINVKACILDAGRGFVRIVSSDPCSCVQGDGVWLHYEAGACLKDWEMLIARLAAAELGQMGCDCSDMSLRTWTEQMPDERWNRTPFGWRRGHVEVYNQLRPYRMKRYVARIN